MATEIRDRRHFAVRNLDGFRYFSFVCEGFTRRLERVILDSGLICFGQCSRKKFYTREFCTAIVLLSTGKSDGNYHVKNLVQYFYLIANQWFNVFDDGFDGRQSDARPPSVLDGYFARQRWFFDYVHVYFSDCGEGQ